MRTQSNTTTKYHAVPGTRKVWAWVKGGNQSMSAAFLSLRVYCAVVFWIMLSSSPGYAQTTLTWTGNATGNNSQSIWSNASNWSPGTIPSTTNNPILIFSGTKRVANSNPISGLNITSITFASGASSFTLSGTGITLGGSVINNSTSNQTISLDLILSGNREVNTNSGIIIISSMISGDNFGITKTGTNQLNLTGQSTFTGTTIVNEGTLQLNRTGGNTLSSSSNVTVNSGNFKITTSQSLNNVTLNGGTITIDAGATLTITGTFSGTGGSIVNNGTLIFNSTINNEVPQIVSGTGVFTKQNSGILTLSGDNTYTGLTTISAGTLRLGAAGGGTNTPLGTTGAGTTVESGAALDLNVFTLGTTEALTLNGTGISSGGALTNSSATEVTYSGLLTLGSASSIITNAGTINITNTGTINGATFGLTLGGSGNGSIASIIGTTSGTVTKSGTGIWTLSGANSYCTTPQSLNQ